MGVAEGSFCTGANVRVPSTRALIFPLGSTVGEDDAFQSCINLINIQG